MTTEPVHQIADGEAVTSCCGRTPFELPRTDRLTVDPSLARGCETEIARATRIGFELGKAEGRKEAGEEIAESIEGQRLDAPGIPHDRTRGWNEALKSAAEIARNLTSQPQEATSEPLTAPGGHSDLPKAPEAARKACANCGAYGGNGRIYRQDDTWDPCPRCTTPRIPGGEG